MKFECPHCHQRLSATPAAAGSTVRCPSCNNRIQVPAPEPEAAAGDRKPADASPAPRGKAERQAWKETDPTNPNFLTTLGIGFGLLVVWFGLLLPFNPPADTPVAGYSTMQFLASLFYKHFVVSLLNTLCFTWSMAILFMKHRKMRHQKAALLLDVLPMNLGKEIDAGNVGAFIDHVYALPARLRDSLMVNRIRKALELFEIRQNVSDVREMMVSQSEIDSARIGGSYTLLRAFLWGIPLLGFIGTVIGLSHAIGGMNFANVEDVTKIVGAINNVTSGLGTAFDATLLGLVLALTLNFPLNTLAKQEDDNLHVIDAFCNEVLLPRLKESHSARLTDTAAIADSVVRFIADTQRQFLGDLNVLAQRMADYGASLDGRMEAFQLTVTQQFVTRTDEMRAQNQAALQQSMDQVAKYLATLEAGIGGLSKVLAELGEKQLIVAAPKKRRWFGRG
jgi:biopolymer transport protein ExbB/TolQ